MAFFRFLDLPREVRDLVYAEYAKHTHINVFCYGSTFSWIATIVETEYLAEKERFADEIAGLLNTSRQLRTEMIEYVGAETTLELSIITLGELPLIVLGSLVPSPVCQKLRHVDLDMVDSASTWVECFQYRRMRALFLDAFPRLQHITIREYGIIPMNLNSKLEDTRPHDSVVKSVVWEMHHKIERIFAHYQDKGLELAIYLTCRVVDFDHVGSDWVRS